ncbi:GNAT family N-acetyltransferase [Amycolatopsis suaedae]|uniref:GNAT family N-acetyltransferase n=1 Tax=Amycolatopsis suaedae TaxID=2510978 RepID=A0A4Q7JDV3_9PSEU|nr:GNAT family N-acetyltransferase [Amycolatopsis suaedae]RZQ65617.1 GNAT family N-acetyltransferase [Amycolatopsis suaedae]
MTGVPVLRSERLTLRGLEPADAEVLRPHYRDPEMSRYFEADLSDPAEFDAMMARRLSYDGPAGLGHWAIEYEGAAVGVAHLRPSWELPGGVPEIGYALARAVGGRGLATEAAARLLGYGLGELGLPAIWALVREDNVPSRKLVERLGFLEVGGGFHYGAEHRVHVALPGTHGRLHHVELWIGDLDAALPGFDWLLGSLGWRRFQQWRHGVSWRLGPTYLVLEQSPALTAAEHDRLRPGLNHLALHVSGRDRVDALAADAAAHGWTPLFADRYPHAGGPDHYAAFLVNGQGFEVELVATPLHPNG